MKKTMFSILAAATILAAAAAPQAIRFDGKRAWEDVKYQVGLGPRTMGSEAHAKVEAWIQGSLKSAGWTAEVREAAHGKATIRNLVGRRGQGRPWILLGAHYDSRFVADHDPDPAKRSLPVPGANDGASGVAVLLELARVLPKDLDKQVWLLFIDAEDNGEIPGWDWILGSRAFAAGLEDKPDAVVIVDMIGDADLNIYREGYSDPRLTDEIWGIASRLGFSQFIDRRGYAMEDDHLPFIERGIRAIDIIDFDYPYWHTTADTPDKVSTESLRAVGETLRVWLVGR
jgi:Zn-dependent M28 family amino/carboxypeptidase